MASATSATAIVDAAPGPIYVDTQHEDVVHDAQMDYYGSKLATCSSDRTVKIYNVSENSYELTATLHGHEGPVWQVAWAHPKFGVLLASCSFDGTILIHREGGSGSGGNASGSNSSNSNKQRQGRGGQQQQQQQQQDGSWTVLHAAQQLHTSSVNGVEFCPHEYGLQLGAASSDGRVSILSHLPNNAWKLDTLQDCALGVNAVSWAPYGAYEPMDDNDDEPKPDGGEGEDAGTDGTNAEATASTTKSSGGGSGGVAPPRLVTAGCDGKIRFWVYKATTDTAMDDGTGGEWVLDTRMGVIKEGNGELQHSDWVRDVAWAPVLVPNENTVASGSEDGTVLIWKQKVPTRKVEGTDEPASSSSSDTLVWKPTLLHNFQEPVWRVSWSVTGHLLAVSSGDSNVTLWKAGLDGTWSQVEEK